MRIIFLPFAGASDYSYRPFSDHSTKEFDVIAVSLPGRGKRFNQPLLHVIDPMVDDLLEQIKPHIDTPYAFFGHSMGACLAYLLTHKLKKLGLPLPKHVFVSGRGAPSIPAKKPFKHLMDSDTFRNMLINMGGVPQELLEDPSILEFYEPIIKADFEAIETYVYKSQDKLNIPITAMLGTEEETSLEDVKAWQHVTSIPIQIKQYPGGHFFIFDHVDDLCSLIDSTIRQTQQSL